MSRPVFRLPSPCGPEAYTTYEVRAPLATHWRAATCEEVACAAYTNGWVTQVDVGTDLGQFQADYIRRTAGRAFTEDWAAPGIVAFSFEPGQRCFASDAHRVRVDRAELYVVRHGDWRGNPTGWSRRHTRASDWVEDMQENQQRVIEAKGRG